MPTNQSLTEEEKKQLEIEMLQNATDENIQGTEKKRKLTGFWYWVTYACTVCGFLFGIDFIFGWRFFSFVEVSQSQYYLMLAFFLAPAFLYFPFKPDMKKSWVKPAFYIDVALFLIVFCISIYLSTKGLDIVLMGWAEMAPSLAVVMAVVMWALLLESIRRAVNSTLAIVVLLFSAYPIFAESMPGLLEGVGRTFTATATYHFYGIDSVCGLLLGVFSKTLIGFITFGIVMVSTGAGQFFLDLASYITGKSRGGPAKVAIISSALFGSISGSAVANVVTTGSVTIPAMKKFGYAPSHAGAIEAVSSSGGTITPPVMGAVAFIMASFLGVPYSVVAIAAAVPAFFYYFVLFIQVDGYAALQGLQGISRSELPPLKQILLKGWFVIPVMGILIYILFELRRIHTAPLIATAICILLVQILPQTRLSIKEYFKIIPKIGHSLTELICLMAGVGTLIGSFSSTGLAVSFAREIILLAGGNTFLIAVLGAVAGAILGMGMPIIPAYIFLSIVLTPALEAAGYLPLTVHMFVLFVAVWSFITPPVALAAYAGATIAGANPMSVGVQACKYGSSVYILPFLILWGPELMLIGETGDIIIAICTATVGMFFIASALCGYMCFMGSLYPGTVHGWIIRALFIPGGILLAIQGTQTDLAGLAFSAAAFAILFFFKIKDKKQGAAAA